MIQKKLLLIGMLSLVPGAVSAMEEQDIVEDITIKDPGFGLFGSVVKLTRCKLKPGEEFMQCSGLASNESPIELRFNPTKDYVKIRFSNEEFLHDWEKICTTKKNERLLKDIFGWAEHFAAAEQGKSIRKITKR